jgi:Ran GTPase-activating protein (RanGAP) involved in mRNA processing and transport
MKRLTASMHHVPQLTHLSLSDNCITGLGLLPLGDGIERGVLPHLTYLSLRDNPVTQTSVPSLLQLIAPSASYSGLTELSLEGCPLRDYGCARLIEGMGTSPFPPLEVLVLSETGFAAASTTALVHLLTHADLSLVELLLSGNPLWTTHVTQLLPALAEAKHLRSMAFPRGSRPDVAVPRHLSIEWT